MTILFKEYQAVLDDLIDQLLNVLDGLPDEAVDWKPGPEMNSIAVLVVHSIESTRYWLGVMGAGEDYQRDRPAEFRVEGKTIAELQQMLNDFRQTSHQSIAKLPDQSLDQKRASIIHKGKTYAVAWSFQYAVSHLATHVGHLQITRQLWDQKGS